MFRALLSHHQETQQECIFGDYCVRLWMWVGLMILPKSWDQPTSTTAQSCIRVVPSEVGQVMPETCRDFEPQ
jgi:hypothetical protein